MNEHTLWQQLVAEAKEFAVKEPLLAPYLQTAILNQPSFEIALGAHLARLLDNPFIAQTALRELIQQVYGQNPDIIPAVCRDMQACRERDAACSHYLLPFLYFKGFHALQVHRVAHALYVRGQCALACFLQNLVSERFAVDIHPAARIGSGILFDHATGVVIGETAVIEDDVSLLHGVTLGGSGLARGKDRHPKIRRGVLLSTGAKVLGCVEVGEGAKVAAGSLVLEDVPAHTTVAGIPARMVGKPVVDAPALSMDHQVEGSPDKR